LLDDDKYREVAHHLANPSSAIFVGSGLSVWSGLPAWRALLDGLIARASALAPYPLDAAKAFLAAGNYLEAAEAVEDVLQPNEIADILRADFSFSRAVPEAPHHLITAFPTQCFVTTNFDSLLESAITLRTKRRPCVVTNLDPADMPSVTRADAREFVFKFHGDIDRASSLVLSRRRYLSGISGPGFQASAMAALRIIMASRPLVFAGYSFNDVDFQTIIQEMRDLFSGAGLPLWAIMPAKPENDPRHMLRTFGIRLLRYPVKSDGGREDHSAFLQVLERLKSEVSQASPQAVGPSPLVFGRYGARLAELRPPAGIEVSGWFSVKVEGSWQYRPRMSLYDALTTADDSFLVTGPAGSGKSFAIRRYLADCGEKLRDAALREPCELPLIPIFLDARLYSGSFRELVETTVPVEVLNAATQSPLSVALILDSVDEMPAQYLEEGSWAKDFSRIAQQFKDPRIIIASRRAELISDELPAKFELSSLDQSEIQEELDSVGVSLSSLQVDLARALETPFLLKLAISGPLYLKTIERVDQLLELFITSRISLLNLPDCDKLLQALRSIAYDTTTSGNDTIPVARLEAALEIVRSEKQEPRAILQDLVRVGLLVAEVGGSVRFSHRSLLEFMASRELVRRLSTDAVALRDLLPSRRWDNVIVWCMSGLPPEHGRKVLDEVSRWDAPLAVRLARNAELGRDALLVQVAELAERPVVDVRRFASEVGETQFPLAAKRRIRKLAKRHDLLGQGFALALLSLLTRKEIAKCLREFPAPVFFATANTYAALVKMLSDQEVDDLLERCGETINAKSHPFGESEDQFPSVEDRVAGVIRGAFDRDQLRTVGWLTTQSHAVRSIACSYFCPEFGSPGYEFVLEQMYSGLSSAIAPVYMALSEADEVESLPFSKEILSFLLDNLIFPDEGSFVGDLLRYLADASEDWEAALTQVAATEKDELRQTAIELVLPARRTGAVRKTFSAIAAGKFEYGQLMEMLAWSDLADEWDYILPLVHGGFETIRAISRALSMGRQPAVVDALTIDRCSETIRILRASDDDDAEWITRVYCSWLGENLAESGRLRLLEIVNEGGEEARFFVNHVLSRVSASVINTDDLSPEARLLLLREYLSSQEWLGSSPGVLATEDFVTQVLLPFACFIDDREQRMKLNRALVDAGNRHGVRYPLLDDGALPPEALGLWY